LTLELETFAFSSQSW